MSLIIRPQDIHDLTPGPKITKEDKRFRTKKYEYKGKMLTIVEACEALKYNEKEIRSVRNFMKKYKCNLSDGIQRFKNKKMGGPTQSSRSTPFGRGI